MYQIFVMCYIVYDFVKKIDNSNCLLPPNYLNEFNNNHVDLTTFCIDIVHSMDNLSKYDKLATDPKLNTEQALEELLQNVSMNASALDHDQELDQEPELDFGSRFRPFITTLNSSLYKLNKYFKCEERIQSCWDWIKYIFVVWIFDIIPSLIYSLFEDLTKFCWEWIKHIPTIIELISIIICLSIGKLIGNLINFCWKLTKLIFLIILDLIKSCRNR